MGSPDYMALKRQCQRRMQRCSTKPQERSAHVVAILVEPPPFQRSSTGMVEEGVLGELGYHVKSGWGGDRRGARRTANHVSHCEPL